MRGWRGQTCTWSFLVEPNIQGMLNVSRTTDLGSYGRIKFSIKTEEKNSLKTSRPLIGRVNKDRVSHTSTRHPLCNTINWLNRVIALINIHTIPDAGCLGLARGAWERYWQRQDWGGTSGHQETHGLGARVPGQQLGDEGILIILRFFQILHSFFGSFIWSQQPGLIIMTVNASHLD